MVKISIDHLKTLLNRGRLLLMCEVFKNMTVFKKKTVNGEVINIDVINRIVFEFLANNH